MENANPSKPGLTLNEYQVLAGRTQKCFDTGYLALGLNEEAGEVAGKIKRIIRDDGGVLTDERREQIKKELGDCLWYTARLAAQVGIALEAVAEANVEKLQIRHARGTISGEGDDR